VHDPPQPSKDKMFEVLVTAEEIFLIILTNQIRRGKKYKGLQCLRKHSGRDEGSISRARSVC